MAEFDDFNRAMLDMVAGSLGLSYEELTRDFREAEAKFVGRAAEPETLAREETLTIVSWHGADEQILQDFGDNPLVRGGFGGIWQDDPPWADYISIWTEAADRARIECLKAYIVQNNIRNGGVWHQREGIPQFSDGSYLYLSQRAWGDLMAAIWGGHYCNFAWED